MRRGEEEDDGEDDEKEGEPSAAMPSNIPTVPESFRMTPLKPDPPGLPVSLESAYQQAGASRYPVKSIHSADDPYYYTTPQKSAGAWDNWSQQGWEDWKGGAEGAESHQGWADWKGGAEGAESLGDRWFQYKTDPWTEARLGWQPSWAEQDNEAYSKSWWGTNGWPGHTDWSWSVPSSWSGWSSQWLKPPDRKDVKGPEVYSGDITHWTQWSKAFTRYLRRRDDRWPDLLEKIQGLKGKPVTTEDEKKWAWDLKAYDFTQFKDQLNEYLESFTSKDARGIVIACGEHNALDAWRQLAERGFSLRPAHINALMRSALWPRSATPLKDLEMAIAMWETDVHTYETAASAKVSAEQKKLNLEEMCPEALRKHLRLLGPEKLSSYEAMRAEIAEWVADEVRKPTRPRAAALEQMEHAYAESSGEADIESMDADQLWQMIIEPASEEMNPNRLCAFVKNLKVKQGKGKGKGPRRCFECNSEEHIASNCLVRAARVAAGGPERLPREADKAMSAPGDKPTGKGNAKGSGKGKGKNNFPA